MFALPFVPLSVGEFLELSDLAYCETAQLFCPNVFQLLWDMAGKRLLSSQVLMTLAGRCWLSASGFRASSFLEGEIQGKRLIAELIRYRRTVLVLDSWKPWITETSFCSIAAAPHVAAQTGDRFGELPYQTNQASIPVAVGANRGQSFVVGMGFSGAGPVNDNLCIGVTGVRRCPSCQAASVSSPHFGCCLSCRRVFVSFAPFSGKCFIEHDDITMQTHAMPHVRRSSPCMEGIVWCHVTEKGAIRFLRQFNGVPLEDTGLIPGAMLPKRIEAYFPNLKIWKPDANQEADIRVSVEHSGHTFPAYMPVSKRDVFEINTTWSILEMDSA